MNAATLAETISKQFTCRDGWYAAHTETGDEYVRFVVEGAADEACAVEAMAEDIHSYAVRWQAQHRTERQVLYWRYAAPHIFWQPEDRRLRTRLVLVPAGKPIVFPTIEAYNEWRLSDLSRKVAEAPHVDEE